jgi:hypothetical protein
MMVKQKVGVSRAASLPASHNQGLLGFRILLELHSFSLIRLRCLICARALAGESHLVFPAISCAHNMEYVLVNVVCTRILLYFYLRARLTRRLDILLLIII